ncbi:MAG: YceI family protein [Gammaproteobacteria bacterium]|nr:YceI family protein [Gammaproteobacteria bacterium]
MTVFGVLLGLALGAASAHAVDYRALDASRSRLGFGYKQMGVTMQGRFKRVTGQIDFDPAQPARAHAAFEVDLASIDTGTEADQEIQGKAWFDTARFPKATFVLQQLQPTGEHQYEATGRLSIKGRAVEVKVPLTLQTQGNTALLKGEFVIRRADFAIGEGSWSKFDVVANDVQIEFQFSVKTI